MINYTSESWGNWNVVVIFLSFPPPFPLHFSSSLCMYALMYVCTDVCMHWCMYALMYVCTDVCMHWRLYALTSVCTDICMHWRLYALMSYALMYVCTDVCIHWCMYALMYVCTDVCMYWCMYWCMYVLMYVCTVCMYALMYVCTVCMYLSLHPPIHPVTEPRTTEFISDSFILFFFFPELGTEPRALHLLGKRSTTEPKSPTPSLTLLKSFITRQGFIGSSLGCCWANKPYGLVLCTCVAIIADMCYHTHIQLCILCSSFLSAAFFCARMCVCVCVCVCVWERERDRERDRDRDRETETETEKQRQTALN